MSETSRDENRSQGLASFAADTPNVRWERGQHRWEQQDGAGHPTKKMGRAATLSTWQGIQGRPGTVSCRNNDRPVFGTTPAAGDRRGASCLVRYLCVLELHSRTHRKSDLHAGRKVAQRLFRELPQRGMSVEDAVVFLRQERPELLRQVRGHVGDAPVLETGLLIDDA